MKVAWHHKDTRTRMESFHTTAVISKTLAIVFNGQPLFTLPTSMHV
jgi:molybdopterin biosynthesis enzyme MoaB